MSTVNITDRLTSNGRKEFFSDWSQDFTPRLKRKPSVWASEERIIAAGTGVSIGLGDIRYDHAVMPHCVEQMDSADDPTIRKIVIWAGIRDGKTLSVCANIIGRTVTDAPTNIYSVHPTDDDAARFSEGDIEPMIEACLGGYFVEKKSRDSGRTINFKKFKGGWIRIGSSGALTFFRGTSVGVLLLHELDALNPEAIFKAFGRTTGFSDAIIVMESTGTLAAEITPEGNKVYRSNIEEAYDQGDKRKWFCPCRKCGYLQTTKYEQIKYPTGRYDLARCHCEACDHPHTPSEWRKFAASGKWFPTAGLSESQEKDILNTHHLARALDPTVRSYWRNGFASLLPHAKGFKSKLHQFVADGEAAQRTKEGKKVWMQEVKAELWSPESEGEAPPAWKPIFERREAYGLTVPQGGLYLTAFVDVQKNRLEVGWRAWGRKDESWGMDHVTIPGLYSEFGTWVELVRELGRKFRWVKEDGPEMKLGMAFIDGGKWPDASYKFFVMMAAYFESGHPFHTAARELFAGINESVLAWVRSHCRASKGVGQNGHVIVNRKMQTIGKALKGHNIGTWEAKDRIYERLRMLTADTEGYMHFNERYREEYIQQMVIEQVSIVFERGQEIRKYVNPKAARNEGLDIEVGNLAAWTLHPKNLDMIEGELLAGLEPPKQEETPTQHRPRSNSPFGSGWNL